MDKDFNNQLGMRIYNLRKSQRMSMKTLGEKVNLHESTVSRYEKGLIQSLDIEKLKEFALALGTSPGYLMGLENAELPKQNTTSIGENLKNIRELNKYSIYELSSELGISVDDLKLYESGAKEVPLNILLKFSELFNVSVDELKGVNMFREGNTAFISTDKRAVELHERWATEVGRLDLTDDEMELVVESSLFVKKCRTKENGSELLKMALMMIKQLGKD